jgi:hypothetical protein
MAVVWEQLCGQVVSPATSEHAIMEETFSVRSLPGLCTRTSSSVVDESIKRFIL